ncbi:zf-CCHC domain-containing protein [Tanacetum coccineum]
MIIKKDSKIVKAKFGRKSIALKARKESSDEECSTSGSEDEEYAMIGKRLQEFFEKEEVDVLEATSNDNKQFQSQRSRDDKNGKGDRKCFRCGYPNHLIGECPQPPKDKNQRAFVGGSWSNSCEEADEKVKDETCLVAHASSEGETSLKHSHWPLPTRRTHVDSEENTRGSGICSKLSAKEAQGVTITDCQAGNPCELIYDPTAQIWHPMIE